MRYSQIAILLVAIALIVSCNKVDVSVEKQRYEATNAAFAKERKLKRWSPREVRLLITQKNFAELESIFTTLADNFKSDAAHESPWIDSYESFSEIADRAGGEQAYLLFFNEWVDKSNSYISYAARAHFFLGLALQSRGGAYISETSDEQLAGMHKFQSLALDDFAKVLAMQPDFVPAYLQLIHAGMLTGADETTSAALQEGLRYVPNSYWLRSMYLDSLTPSWGGSYAEMEKFISGFEEAAKQNPRIWSLRGMPDGERAKRFGGQDDYKKAVEYYTKALSYGDRLYYLKRRAYYSYQLHDYESVIRDVNRIATYGRGEESVRFILENIEIEKAAGENAPPRLTWGSFDFQT
jgi:tetratricopeptide (TPR) repeat protein